MCLILVWVCVYMCVGKVQSLQLLRKIPEYIEVHSLSTPKSSKWVIDQ